MSKIDKAIEMISRGERHLGCTYTVSLTQIGYLTKETADDRRKAFIGNNFGRLISKHANDYTVDIEELKNCGHVQYRAEAFLFNREEMNIINKALIEAKTLLGVIAP